MSLLNLQQTYDRVRDHLIKQNERSIKDSACMYLNPKGLRCAIGCLLPEGMTAKDYKLIEGKSFNETDHVPTFVGKTVDLNSPNIRNMLTDLQRMHDHSTPKEWPTTLKQIANRYMLEY